jgi:hypothetical protein
VSALKKDNSYVIIGTGRQTEKDDIPMARKFTGPPFSLKFKKSRYLPTKRQIVRIFL